jgi:hypothetical protein
LSVLEALPYRLRRKAEGAISQASLSAWNRLSWRGVGPRAIHFEEPIRVLPSIDKLAGLEGIGEGRRALLLGTAPSVRDLGIEDVSDAYVMVLNRGFLLSDRLASKPNSLIFSNPYAVQEYGEEAFSQKWEHLFLSCSSAGFSDRGRDESIAFSQWEAPRMEKGFFQFDGRRPLYHSGSVAHSALQMLVWMGFDEVFMAGVDLTFPKDDPHFYETKSAEKVRSYQASQANAENMVRGLEIAKAAVEERGATKVMNVGAPGSRNPFRHVEWSSVF